MTKAGAVELANPAATGLSVLPLLVPICAHPERLLPLVEVASILRSRLPGKSTNKVRGAIRRWTATLDWWGMEANAVTDVAVCAFVILRVSPPTGLQLPTFATSPVTPPTAANDVDALRRAARLGLGGMEVWLDALNSPRVAELLRALGARVKRLKTSKTPLLLRDAVRLLEKAEASRKPEAVRDAFALVLALIFGLRVSELLALDAADLAMDADTNVVTLTIRACKTRSTVFSHHDPYRVSSAHPTLQRALRLHKEVVGFRQGTSLVHRLCGRTRDRLSRDWFAAVVRNTAPGCTPHSCRVGFATELRAAGASIADIMSLGRWASAAALLYVLSVQDDHVSTSKRLGDAGLSLTNGVLRRDGATLKLADAPKTDGLRWATMVAGEESDESDDEEQAVTGPPLKRRR